MAIEIKILLLVISIITIISAYNAIKVCVQAYRRYIQRNVAILRAQDNHSHRAQFFLQCETITQDILGISECSDVEDFFQSKGFSNKEHEVEDILGAIVTYLYRHANCSDALIDVFCIAAFFRLMILCDSNRYDDITNAPWYPYTLHGDRYPKDNITRFLGVLEIVPYRLDRMYLLVNSLFLDKHRRESFAGGNFLQHVLKDEYDSISKEIYESNEVINDEIIDAFRGENNVPTLLIVDKNRIKSFIDKLYA